MTRDAEIERLRALVQKRERQLVWAAENWLNRLHDKKTVAFQDPESPDLRKYVDTDGTDTGLLAAIDEATETKEKK